MHASKNLNRKWI